MTLNLVEAAALLRIHKNTLQGRAHAGHLASFADNARKK